MRTYTFSCPSRALIMRDCLRECDTLYRERVYQHTCALSLKVKTEYTDMTRILAAGASQGPLQVIYDFVPPQSFALSLSGVRNGSTTRRSNAESRRLAANQAFMFAWCYCPRLQNTTCQLMPQRKILKSIWWTKLIICLCNQGNPTRYL